MLSRITSTWPWEGWLEVLVHRHREHCPAVLAAAPCRCWPELVAQDEVHNLITTVGKNLARDMLRGVAADAKIRQFGLGTSSTAPAVGQTSLVAESFRKGTTSEAAGASGEALITCYVAPAEAVFNIQEIGFFAGPLATAVANSGVMVARVLYSRNKTAVESLQIVRHDQF